MVDDSKKRQAKLVARDKAAGIKTKKLRLAKNEVLALQSVSAEMMLNQSETIVSLIYDKAHTLGLPVYGAMPEVTTLHIRKTDEAIAALNAATAKLGRSPAYVIERALVDFAKSLDTQNKPCS